MKNKVRWFSNKRKTDHHGTPDRVKEYLKLFKIDWNNCFDPCPLKSKFDGLKINWKKQNVINPPYDLLEEFAEKAYNEYLRGKTSYFLFPLSHTDKSYWDYFLNFKKIYFPFRIKFIGSKQPAFQTHVLVILK